MAICGAAFMGARLAGGIDALVLLPVSIAAGITLAVMIMILGPVSGGHFNPAVTVVMAVRGNIGWPVALGYGAAQILGGVSGVMLANAMYGGPLLQVATVMYGAPGQWLGEAVATFGLVLVILLAVQHVPKAVGPLVGGYIVAAHWMTSSSSFANPAVAIARMFSGGPAGLSAGHMPPFIAAELLGAALALIVFRAVFAGKTEGQGLTLPH